MHSPKCHANILPNRKTSGHVYLDIEIFLKINVYIYYSTEVSQSSNTVLLNSGFIIKKKKTDKVTVKTLFTLILLYSFCFLPWFLFHFSSISVTISSFLQTISLHIFFYIILLSYYHLSPLLLPCFLLSSLHISPSVTPTMIMNSEHNA